MPQNFPVSSASYNPNWLRGVRIGFQPDDEYYSSVDVAERRFNEPIYGQLVSSSWPYEPKYSSDNLQLERHSYSSQLDDEKLQNKLLSQYLDDQKLGTLRQAQSGPQLARIRLIHGASSDKLGRNPIGAIPNINLDELAYSSPSKLPPGQSNNDDWTFGSDQSNEILRLEREIEEALAKVTEGYDDADSLQPIDKDIKEALAVLSKSDRGRASVEAGEREAKPKAIITTLLDDDQAQSVTSTRKAGAGTNNQPTSANGNDDNQNLKAGDKGAKISVDSKKGEQPNNRAEEFGKVINYKSEDESKPNANTLSSLFGKIYNAARNLINFTELPSNRTINKKTESSGNLSDGKRSTSALSGDTKPGVSKLKVDADSETTKDNQSNHKSAINKADKNQSEFLNNQKESSKRKNDNKTKTIPKAADQSNDEKQYVSEPQDDGSKSATITNNNQINSMRAANLLVPFGAPNDEQVGQQMTTADGSSNGNSIGYLPSEHHYHMNTRSWRQAHSVDIDSAVTGLDGGDHDPRYNSFKNFPQSHYSTNYPGYPSFGDYKSIYDNRDRSSVGILPHQTNDLYFLVVVGAFCVMAVAMILAAGLFAYRVQQNRKTNTETDYPTYGVVGPNNLSGKCAANGPSFVGGYFNNNPGFGLACVGVNKFGVGSAKNSPDCFSPNDSGICNLSQKPSGKKSPSDARPPSFMASQQNAARMYHYQHQKQQMISSDRTSNGRHTSASDLDSEEENEDGNYTVYECPGLASAHDMEIKNPLFNDDRSP